MDEIDRLRRGLAEAQHELRSAARAAEGLLDPGADLSDAGAILLHYREASVAATRAKQAVDDAYATREIAMEPPPFKASSDEDREEWIRRLDGDLLDAFARVTTLRAQHEALPGLSLKEIEDPALTFEERLVLIDRELERFDKVLPIIDQLEQAEKDMRDALVGLKRAMPEE